MAARWNSSRAPESPRSRMRSKPWWVFRCANRISTRFRSSRDLANAFVFIFRRATSRASLMQVARNLARVGVGATLRSDRAYIAVALRGAVEKRASVVHGAAGPEQFATRANVDPALSVPAEVRA